MKKGIFVCIFLFLFLISNASAATYFVKIGGSNALTGNNWNNAWSSIQWASVGAGDTICYAGSTTSYGSLSLTEGGSIASPMTIKRATTGDPTCGSSVAGWSSSFDSVVNFGSAKLISNFIIDGMVPNGIKFKFNGGSGVYFDPSFNQNIVLKNLEIEGPGTSYTTTDGNNCPRALSNEFQLTYGGSNINISRVTIHDSAELIQLDQMDNVLVEYSTLYNSKSGNDALCHGNVFFVGSGSDYGTFRYNNVYMMSAEGLYFAYSGNTGWKIYGNVFHDYWPASTGRGIEWNQGGSFGTFQVHNNVFYNLYNGLNARGPTSGEGYNNIFSGASGSWSNIVTGDNINGNIFKDAANGDFTLAANAVSAINQGTPLAAEYSKDANGNTRGADGGWDIGAFELSTCTTCRYVRQGATGTNNGSDWTNAYTSLPATLTRGYTYYIADGNYSGYTFDDATSGSQYITVKKATTGDHGTDTGWSNTYADSQTIFSGLQFAGTSYYILDGQIDKGMYTSFTGCGAGITLNGNSQYIELKNIEIEGPGVGYSYTCGGEAPGIYIPAVSLPSTNKASHILIHNVDIHDMNAGMWIFDSNNMTVQYSEIYDIGSGNEDTGNGVGTHSNLMYVDKSSNFTVRYNNIHNYISTGIYCAYDSNNYRGFKVYGNVFHDTVAPLIGRPVQVEIYNNAFYNAGSPDGNFINLNSALAGSIVRNNIFWGGGSLSYNSNVVRSNNMYKTGYWGYPNITQEPTGTFSATSPFIDAAGGNFNIVSTISATTPRDKGLNLGVGYNNVDGNGITRGADGSWDIGAYEVSGSAINGVCSSTINQCSFGTFSEITDNSTHYLWQCVGSSGGSTASCSILITPQNGVCGNAARTYVNGETFPTGNLCQVGNSNPTSPTLGTGNGASTSWTCSGLAGGSTSPTCTAVRDATCQSTTTAWQNIQLGSSLTGYFTATFNVTPTVLGDAVYGLAPASATDYTSLATIVRFNDSNAIDVRNGLTYSSTNTVSYNVGTTYQIRIVANVTSKTYSVYVKAGSAAEVLIANNFAFRSDQSTASSLSYFSFIGSTGDANVCSFSTSIPTVPNTVYHPADTNNNLALTPSETTAYINSYFSGSNSITESLYALTLLQSGGSYSNIDNTNCASTPWNCWVSSGSSAPVDTTPPSVTASGPSTTVTSSSATLSVSTSEAATCRYSTSAGAAYVSMTQFSTTGSTSHTNALTGLTNGVKNYYVKCQDSSSNTMVADHTITFTVSIATGGTTCEAAAGDNCFYIDSSAAAGGNGQSWTSAWNAFSAITWGSVGDGDYIYISGGSTSKTYSSALTVGASGSASKPLTIKIGQDTNHNGNAIIDINGGQNSIVLSGRNYVTVDGEFQGSNKITLTDAFTGLFASSSTGVKVKNMDLIYLNRPIDFASSTGLVIDGNNLTQVRGQSGQDGTAIDVAQSCASGVYDNVIVANNHVEISSDGFGPDGVKPCSGQTYSNNTFRSMPAQSFVVTTTEHSDIFQGNGGSYIKIINNDFINVPEAVINFGSWTSNPVSNIYIFNNIFRIDDVMDQLPEYFRVYANPGTIPSITNIKFINNIFIDNNPTGWAYSGCDYAGGAFCPVRFGSYNTNPTATGNEFKNNIFYNMGSATDSQGAFLTIDASTSFTATSWNFSNNAYYHPGNNFYIKVNGITYNKTQIAAREPTASMVQPQFVSYTNLGTNNNLRLAAGDTGARDRGTNLNSYCSQAAMAELCFDKDGRARPALGNWNAGPFEN